MNKTWLIIRREYLSRVRNKTFLLSTFLTPILFVVVIGVVIFITVKGSNKEKVAVIDSTGIFKDEASSSNDVDFVIDPAVDTANFTGKGYTAVLYSPNTGINQTNQWRIYSRKNFGVMQNEQVNRKLRQEFENDLLAKEGIDVIKMDSIRAMVRSVSAEAAILEGGSNIKRGNSGLAYGIGYGAAFLIYITLFVYGAMVMRGVMEEKTNRIAEVIVSSVKPFQLMMGKIIGIGAVGLTQFFLWIILIGIFSVVLGFLIPPELMQQVQTGQISSSSQQSEALIGIATAQHQLSSVNWPLIIGCFIFYFLFGYLFYASLFAAVGSAVNEDPQDAQSLMLPITMPIILSIIIMMNAIVHPEGSLATWSSMIPFFSPIIMMARIPFGVPGTVPWWQLGTSMALLVAGFLLTTWLSAKIYRTGILMYGKKPTWKEMWKWTFRKL